MANNNYGLSSDYVINQVLQSIGLTRNNLSTYQQYQSSNGDIIRLRISDHGIFLQHWYDKNREARMNGQNTPKLDVGMNLALTFAPNEQECLSMGISFPMKIKNVTTAKTQQGNNVKPQFKIRHICYYSWELTQEDVDSISNSLRNCISSGDDFVEPLGGDPNKVVEWEDTSNLPPQKVSGNTLQQNRNNTNNTRNNNPIKENRHMKQTIKLTESELRNMITESVKRVLNEEQQKYVSMEVVKRYAQGLLKAIESNDNAQILLYGSTLQKWLGPTIAQLQQQQPMQQSQQQPMQQSQQPMQQQQQSQHQSQGMPNWMRQYMQPQQIQQMQQPPQQRQQPTSTNNNTMIDNQVQQQMQRNMGLQQKMANKIRQQKMAKFN